MRLLTMVVVAGFFAAPASAAEENSEPEVIRLAAPGLSTVDVDEARAEFLNDYFADQLTARGAGRFKVITQSEVRAVLGQERQRQLLGCDDSSSCLAELAGALGSDALVVGNVARFGTRYAMTLKVVSARDATVLASTSNKDMTEEAVLDWMSVAARDLGRHLAPDLPESEEELTREKNALYLSLLGAEYGRRISGPWWVGARAGAALGYVTLRRNRGPAFATHGSGIVRFHPTWFTGPFGYSFFGGVGFGGGFGNGGEKTDGAMFSVGAEAHMANLRFSLELMFIDDWAVLVPGLAYGVRF